MPQIHFCVGQIATASIREVRACRRANLPLRIQTVVNSLGTVAILTIQTTVFATFPIRTDQQPQQTEPTT